MEIGREDTIRTMAECKHRIGNLPDEILRKILALLPTKDAVRTSVLSKRWEHLWMSTPNLSFDTVRMFEESRKDSDSRKLFMNFVEKALMLRNSSDIHKFGLSCQVLSDAPRINTWILAAVKHNVRTLRLYLESLEEPVVLPHGLFTCETLEELYLSFSCDLKLPPLVCFSNLRVLRLWKVILQDGHAIKQLLSGCPVLKMLHLFDCKWDKVGSLCFSAPSLECLSIDETEGPSDHLGSQVVVSGINLKNFMYCGDLNDKYSLCNLPSLVHADIDLTYIELSDLEPSVLLPHSLHELLRGLYNVKSLTLSTHTVEVLSYAEELWALMPIFYNLTLLKVEHNVGYSEINLSSGGALLNILRKSPYLSYIIFVEALFCEDDDWIMDQVPPCFLTHLKIITIGSFKGTESQLHAVKILLKNAKVLERMVIRCEDNFCPGMSKLKEIVQQLLTLPKGSSICEIDFGLYDPRDLYYGDC